MVVDQRDNPLPGFTTWQRLWSMMHRYTKLSKCPAMCHCFTVTVMDDTAACSIKHSLNQVKLTLVTPFEAIIVHYQETQDLQSQMNKSLWQNRPHTLKLWA